MKAATRAPALETFETLKTDASRRRQWQSADMDITPMIDITFLLLIFFLVATRIESMGAVELPEARTGTAISENAAVVISMRPAADGTSEIFKGEPQANGSRLTATDLAAQERELVTHIREQLLQFPAKKAVLLKAAKDTRQREIMRVAEAVALVPDTQLHFAVLESN